MSIAGDTRLPTPSPSSMGTLRPSLPAMDLFGYVLLVFIGEVLIVPFPWAAAELNKFLCGHVALPNGKRLEFTGRGGDIWYVFMAMPGLMWVIQAISLAAMLNSGDPVAFAHSSQATLLNVAGVAVNFVFLALEVVILRWFVAHVTSPDQPLSLGFGGSILAFIGWHLLIIVSAFTIVGWAWAIKFMLRWMCRNVTGTLAFDFVGSGLAILWRSIVTWLACIFIIPIPWMMRWYVSWIISQVAVVQPAAKA